MVIAFAISIFTVKIFKARPIFYLLTTSIIVEVIVEVLKRKGENHFPMYHYFTLLEYFLFSFFYYINFNIRIINRLILASMPVFLIFFIFFSSKNALLNFPSLIGNIEYSLCAIWSTLYLLYIDPGENNLTPIFKNGFFWISLGIIFYSNGTFFFNGFYNELKSEFPAKAKFYFDIVNSVFNWIFYIFISIGLYFLWKYQHYSKQ